MNAVVIGTSGQLGEKICTLLESKNYNVIKTCFSENKIGYYNLDMSNKKGIDEFSKYLLSKEKIDFFTSTVSQKPTVNRFDKIEFTVFEKDNQIALNHLYLMQKINSHFNKDALIVFILSEMVNNDRLKYASSYAVSKHTMLGIFKILSQELKDVRVNAISPGMMDTKFIKDIPRLSRETYNTKYGFTRIESVIEKINTLIEDKTINGQNIP